jgi:thioredoxin 1
MELKLFYMQGCPYCQCAFKVIDELIAEHPEYAKIKITKIEENTEPEVASQYDYYHVPTFFLDKKKLYEAQPGDDAATMKPIIGKILANMK